jgi:hypothetical protein
MALEA